MCVIKQMQFEWMLRALVDKGNCVSTCHLSFSVMTFLHTSLSTRALIYIYLVHYLFIHSFLHSLTFPSLSYSFIHLFIHSFILIVSGGASQGYIVEIVCPIIVRNVVVDMGSLLCVQSGAIINTIKTLNISHALGNKIVYHSDVVGASPDGTAPTTSSF